VTRPLDIVLLLALPASGKSEVRKYLASVPAVRALEDFRLGPTLQLDDYPYVHMMRRISEVLRQAGHSGVFFDSPDQSMREPLDWGTLIELVNDDFADLSSAPSKPESCGAWMLDRFDAARARLGIRPELEGLPSRLRSGLVAAIDAEARTLWEDMRAQIPPHPRDLDGKTVVIEFARGGPQGASMPLPEPLGYEYSLAQLSDDILARAAILYIWVTPEESRRKNRDRARPGRAGDASILHHGVPETVMLQDYGCDDMESLIARAARPDTVRIEARGRHFDLPVARFDNRIDKTSFIREDSAHWAAPDVAAVHAALQEAFERLARASAAR